MDQQRQKGRVVILCSIRFEEPHNVRHKKILKCYVYIAWPMYVCKTARVILLLLVVVVVVVFFDGAFFFLPFESQIDAQKTTDYSDKDRF